MAKWTTSCQVEFGVNADAQHFLSRRGEEQAAAVGAFGSEVDTLVSRTMEDTMVNVKQYHRYRSVTTTANGQSLPPL